MRPRAGRRAAAAILVVMMTGLGCAQRQRLRVISRTPHAQMRWIAVSPDGKKTLSEPRLLPAELEVTSEPPGRNGGIAAAVGGGLAVVGTAVGGIGFAGALGEREGGFEAFIFGAVLTGIGLVTTIIGATAGIAEVTSLTQTKQVILHVRAPDHAHRAVTLDVPFTGCARGGTTLCRTIMVSPLAPERIPGGPRGAPPAAPAAPPPDEEPDPAPPSERRRVIHPTDAR